MLRKRRSGPLPKQRDKAWSRSEPGESAQSHSKKAADIYKGRKAVLRYPPYSLSQLRFRCRRYVQRSLKILGWKAEMDCPASGVSAELAERTKSR